MTRVLSVGLGGLIASLTATKWWPLRKMGLGIIRALIVCTAARAVRYEIHLLNACAVLKYFLI